jgi:hypothetical protein
MPSINKLDLNIGKSCLDNWEICHAIRELIANAVDEHIHCDIKKTIEIIQDNNNFQIIDFGRGLQQRDFIQQTNKSKITDNKYIGQFGIGLKDSLGVLCKNNIKVNILTNRYKFKPVYHEKTGLLNETLHIEVYDNNNGDVKDGTKIVLFNIEKKDMDLAKNYFLNYTTLKHSILYESTESIYEFDKKQFIFVNGMKTCETSTATYFSYDIKKTKDIMKSLNRDRDDKEFGLFKDDIRNILQNINLFNERKIKNNFLEKIINILSKKDLKEFEQIDVIRKILKQLNDQNKYVFVDILDKIKINKKKLIDKFKEKQRTVIFLGEGIKKKLYTNIKMDKKTNIKELYGYKIFKDCDDDLYTLNHPDMFPPCKKDTIIIKIKDLINGLKEKLSFDIPKKVENVLINLEIIDEDDDISDYNSESEDEDEDGDYKKNNNYVFTKNKFKIKESFLNDDSKISELKAIILNYILENISADERINFLKNIIIDKNEKNWFSFLSKYM